jgi:hypothetical protein
VQAPCTCPTAGGHILQPTAAYGHAAGRGRLVWRLHVDCGDLTLVDGDSLNLPGGWQRVCGGVVVPLPSRGRAKPGIHYCFTGFKAHRRLEAHQAEGQARRGVGAEV